MTESARRPRGKVKKLKSNVRKPGRLIAVAMTEAQWRTLIYTAKVGSYRLMSCYHVEICEKPKGFLQTAVYNSAGIIRQLYRHLGISHGLTIGDHETEGFQEAMREVDSWKI